MLGAFLLGLFLGWLVASSRRSAIDHALERGVQIRNPHPMPPTKPDPPPAPPWHRPVINDPTLGPDQEMAVNQLEVCRRARAAESSGWPT